MGGNRLRDLVKTGLFLLFPRKADENPSLNSHMIPFKSNNHQVKQIIHLNNQGAKEAHSSGLWYKIYSKIIKMCKYNLRGMEQTRHLIYFHLRKPSGFNFSQLQKVNKSTSH